MNSDKYKNIFMVLYGHVPSTAYTKGNFDPAPYWKQADANGKVYTPTVWAYQFDYQLTGDGNCSSYTSNMPQHPLIRSYDFTLDTNNKTLSWHTYDAQAWSKEQDAYQHSGWHFPTPQTPPPAERKAYLEGAADGSINYSNYVLPK